MKYRQINPSTHALLSELEDSGGGVKLPGYSWVRARDLCQFNIYPVVEVLYNDETEVVSELYFDSSRNIITRRVFPFAQGRQMKWHCTQHILVATGWVLARPWRVRVLFAHTQGDGPLATRAAEMLIAQSPFFRVDASGEIDPLGDWLELYLSFIQEADIALLSAYCTQVPNSFLQNYYDYAL